MKFRRRSRRFAVIGLAALGLAAPAAQARPIEQPLPPAGGAHAMKLHGSPAGVAQAIHEQQVLASRGQGAPRPVVTSQYTSSVGSPRSSSAPGTQVTDGGLDWGSVGLGAAGFAAVVAAFALANAVLARRARVQAVR